MYMYRLRKKYGILYVIRAYLGLGSSVITSSERESASTPKKSPACLVNCMWLGSCLGMYGGVRILFITYIHQIGHTALCVHEVSMTIEQRVC